MIYPQAAWDYEQESEATRHQSETSVCSPLRVYFSFIYIVHAVLCILTPVHVWCSDAQTFCVCLTFWHILSLFLPGVLAHTFILYASCSDTYIFCVSLMFWDTPFSCKPYLLTSICFAGWPTWSGKVRVPLNLTTTTTLEMSATNVKWRLPNKATNAHA